MRPNGKVAAALVLACAVVGCSKRGESPQAKADGSKPVAASGEPVAFKSADGEGFNGAAASKTTGPVSFGDGEAAYHAKNYAEATKRFEEYTTRRPNNAWGHYMLGLSAWKSGDLVKSESAFETALRVDPKHVKSYVNLKSRAH